MLNTETDNLLFCRSSLPEKDKQHKQQQGLPKKKKKSKQHEVFPVKQLIPQVCQCLRGIHIMSSVIRFNFRLVLKWSGSWPGLRRSLPLNYSNVPKGKVSLNLHLLSIKLFFVNICTLHCSTCITAVRKHLHLCSDKPLLRTKSDQKRFRQTFTFWLGNQVHLQFKNSSSVLVRYLYP